MLVFFFRGNLDSILQALDFAGKKTREYYERQIESVDGVYHEVIRKEMQDRLAEINRVIDFLKAHSARPWLIDKVEHDHLTSVIRSALDIYICDLQEQKKRTGVDAFDQMIDAVKEAMNLDDIKTAATGRFDKFYFSTMQKGSDPQFMRMAIEEAKESKGEDDRPHPRVGVVVAGKDGQLLAKAHRGELALGDHAEYTVLERKLRDKDLTGATLYTTLEPCTTRGPEKTPCADRIIQRKIARVVIGMMDPNPNIRGAGLYKIKEAKIEVGFFDTQLEEAIRNLNQDFIAAQAIPAIQSAVVKPEDQNAYSATRAMDDYGTAHVQLAEDLTESVSRSTFSNSQSEIVVALRKFIAQWQQFKEQGGPVERLEEIVTVALHTSDNIRMLGSKFASTWTPDYLAKAGALADELQRFSQSYTGSLDARRYGEILSMGDDSYKSSCELITMAYEKS